MSIIKRADHIPGRPKAVFSSPVSSLTTLGTFNDTARCGPPAVKARLGALRRCSSACDSFGPIRALTNRPRVSKKIGCLRRKYNAGNKGTQASARACARARSKATGPRDQLTDGLVRRDAVLPRGQLLVHRR